MCTTKTTSVPSKTVDAETKYLEIAQKFHQELSWERKKEDLQKAICIVIPLILPLDYDYNVTSNIHVNEEAKPKAIPDVVVQFEYHVISISEMKIPQRIV